MKQRQVAAQRYRYQIPLVDHIGVVRAGQYQCGDRVCHLRNLSPAPVVERTSAAADRVRCACDVRSAVQRSATIEHLQGREPPQGARTHLRTRLLSAVTHLRTHLLSAMTHLRTHLLSAMAHLRTTFRLLRMVHLSRRGPPRFWSDVAKERSD
ncbi:hypothetical protein GCM10011588_54240 [Nocardia jinanensis]|uniref:Uncharacterized protein n=1 Tax=Nocardia jinanensis TaxID=382504 RepID=A0A917RUD0_9NOCA|nr:hypothetical protein GCM10011588_54240 [Nocardia jinanensis]